MSPIGTSRRFAAAQQLCRFRVEADNGLNFMSTGLPPSWGALKLLSLPRKHPRNLSRRPLVAPRSRNAALVELRCNGAQRCSAARLYVCDYRHEICGASRCGICISVCAPLAGFRGELCVLAIAAELLAPPLCCGKRYLRANRDEANSLRTIPQGMRRGR
jgi:hypothetical protein